MRIRKLILSFLIIYNYSCFAKAETKYSDDFEKYNNSINPGVAVAVLQDNQILIAKGYGYENLDNKNKITADTNFNLASITKQFVAMIAAILSEKGLLNINDKITKFYPDFPEYGKDITINHLIHHTSGLPDYMQNLCSDKNDTIISNKEVVAFLYQQTANLFNPGSQFEYSNTGYIFLASILEKVSGIPFDALVAKEILQPLQMYNTKVGFANIKDKQRAYGYGVWPFFDLQDTNNCSYVIGDSEIYSSVNDLAKWALALQNNNLVSANTMQTVFSNFKLNSGEIINYGYGWFLKDSQYGPIYAHNGSRLGFRSWIVYFPDKQMWFIILTNTSVGIYGLNKLLAPYVPGINIDFLSS